MLLPEHAKKKAAHFIFTSMGSKKIFEQLDTENINIIMASKLKTKKPEVDPVIIKVKKKNGEIHGIHRAVEIVWKGAKDTIFVLQKSSDLQNWKTVDTLSGNGNMTCVFLRISGTAQFWRMQPE